MSTYVKAVLKMANIDDWVNKPDNIQDILKKCVDTGIKLFSFKGRIYLIIYVDKKTQNSVNYGGQEYSCVGTPLDLEDFEV